MGASVASLLVLTVLFTGVLMTLKSSWLGDNRINGAVAGATKNYDDRNKTALAITSSVGLSVFRCDTGVEVTVDNVGEMTVNDFARMDVLTWYTLESGDTVTKDFEYSDGNLEKGEWSVGGISPDNNSPGFDPGETATLVWRFDQPQMPNTSGYLTVVTPNGVSDSDYVEFMDVSRGDCRFLHNFPTPPQEDTFAQSVLPMGTGFPAAATLYNYDSDQDTDAGLTLVRSQNGIDENVAGKFQVWRTGPLTQPLTISGDVLVDLWSALVPAVSNEVGILIAYLRDYDGAAYSEIGQGAIFARDWQQGSTGLVERMALIEGIDYTLPPGNELELRIIADIASAHDIAVGYDTKDYPSLLNLSFTAPDPSLSLYFHNDPTPPVADTARQAVLPLDAAIPTAGTLYQYGNPGNNPGLLLKGTDQGLTETDPTKFQTWLTPVLAAPLSIDGDVLIDIWAGIRQFQSDQSGAITIYLRDKDGESYTEIANGSVFAEDWQGESNAFIRKTIMIPDVDYTVPQNHQLEARMMSDTIKASKDMWFAYDTAAHPSAINLP